MDNVSLYLIAFQRKGLIMQVFVKYVQAQLNIQVLAQQNHLVEFVLNVILQTNSIMIKLVYHVMDHVKHVKEI